MKARILTKETILDYGTEKRSFPNFKVGDTIEIAQVIKEGEKERFQMFQGDVITFHKNGISSTFTVRKIGANGVGVEKIFPYYSKNVDSVKIIKKGKVRRARLTYLRTRVGKAAKLKEQVLTKTEKAKEFKIAE